MSKTKYSLTNSLSSAGTSSASSVNSAPSNIGGIANNAERTIVRIPTIISLTHGVIEISRYPLRRRTLERSTFLEISNPKRSTTLQLDSEESKFTSIGMESLAVQRICCYESDLEHIDRVSSSSCDTKQTIDPFDCFNNSRGDDTGGCVTVENDVGDNDDDNNDSDTAIGNDYVFTSDDIDNDEVNVFDHVVSSANITTTAAPIPISESVFDSTALNHVIMLDDDVISGEDDDDDGKIRILKL